MKCNSTLKTYEPTPVARWPEYGDEWAEGDVIVRGGDGKWYEADTATVTCVHDAGHAVSHGNRRMTWNDGELGVKPHENPNVLDGDVWLGTKNRVVSLMWSGEHWIAVTSSGAVSQSEFPKGLHGSRYRNTPTNKRVLFAWPPKPEITDDEIQQEVNRLVQEFSVVDDDILRRLAVQNLRLKQVGESNG